MTKTKTLFTVLLFSVAPGIAAAGCFGYGQQEASISCADGTVWDAQERACVAKTS
ncbi:MAG: adenylosuccinate lyase [Pseudomonadota bacterium]